MFSKGKTFVWIEAQMFCKFPPSDGMNRFIILNEKDDFYRLFCDIGLKTNFHWFAHCVIVTKSFYNFSWVSVMSVTREKREESFIFSEIPSVKSFIYTKNKGGPSTDPCGSLSSSPIQFDGIPSRTTHCLFSRR